MFILTINVTRKYLVDRCSPSVLQLIMSSCCLRLRAFTRSHVILATWISSTYCFLLNVCPLFYKDILPFPCFIRFTNMYCVSVICIYQTILQLRNIKYQAILTHWPKYLTLSGQLSEQCIKQIRRPKKVKLVDFQNIGRK